MLKDDIKELTEENPEQIEEKEVVCRFCGQYRKAKVLKDWGIQDLDEIGVELCNCAEAQGYTVRKYRKERALSKARKMFSDESEQPIKENVLSMIYASIELADKEEIKKVTIEIEKGLKANIQLTAKETIKVERSRTEKKAFEE